MDQQSPTPGKAYGRELFLVLEQLSTQLPHLLRLLYPMSQSPEATQLLAVDALYQRDKDLAMLCLRFDASGLDRRGVARLVALATEAGIPVLDPQQLSAADQKLFYQQYLRRYAVRINDQRSPIHALRALGQLVGLLTKQDSEGVPPRAPSPAACEVVDEDSATRVEGPSARRRHDSADIPLILAPVEDQAGARTARGSQSDVDSSEQEFGDCLPTEVEGQTVQGMDLGPAGPRPDARPRGKSKRPDRLATIPAHAAARAPSPTPHTISRGAARVEQAADELSAERRQEFPLPLPPPPAAPQGPTSRAFQPSQAIATPAPVEPVDESVRVRWQRGDAWMPARLRNLTTKEVRLASSAAPPLGHAARVSVTIAEFGVVLNGMVVEVVNTERSVDGSTSFRIEFQSLSRREKDKLVELLRMAQRQGVSLTPPPPRRNRRFAISWPIAVVSEGHRINAAALDISEEGLFLATTAKLRASQLVFGIPLDRTRERVQGRARVARRVSESMARRRGLSAGYGLQIEDWSPADRQRFNAFLLRVRQRSQHHIIVAGIGERSHMLAECFQSAGYAVSKASSVETMMLRTPLDHGCADLAVMDDASLSAGLQSAFASTFQTHDVPILRLQGQAPYVARDVVDHTMHV